MHIWLVGPTIYRTYGIGPPVFVTGFYSMLSERVLYRSVGATGA